MNRLSCLPLKISHANELFQLWSSEEIIKYTNINKPCTFEETKKRINRLEKFDVFVILLDNKIIGIVGCPCINKEEHKFGLFYQIKKEFWGQGLATKAVKWILDFMINKYRYAVFFADVIVDNTSSEKILKRCNFKLTSEETINKNGKNFLVHNYIYFYRF